jgi:tRNA wybutosine-synthesizing protein 1
MHDNLIQITPQLKARLQKAKYGVYNHSAVELCHWTKKSFADGGNCYKHKFYGISTHQCMEMTPTAMNCENRCIYCWRPTEFYDTLQMPEELVDEPDIIIEQLMAERKKLINGFYGDPKNNKKKLDESLLPAHYAISLSGEPTMYPKLPTQIYLSTNASNKKMFYQINRPRHRDAWERWWESLRLLATLNTRTVLRMTLIKGYNDSYDFVREFADMMVQGNPHFIELKSYMHIGRSTQRLEQDHMLEMNEIRNFAANLCAKMCSFKIMDESEISRIVVLQNEVRYVDRWIKEYML